jgi:molybdopterin-guanine dinucleotide biosynthesis protein B
MVEMMPDFDYLLVEGLKTVPLPRVGVFRDSVDDSYFEYISAVATDGSIESGSEIFKDFVTLDLNSPDEVIEWIDNNGKEI